MLLKSHTLLLVRTGLKEAPYSPHNKLKQSGKSSSFQVFFFPVKQIKIFKVFSCKICKMKAAYFFRRNKKINPQTSFGIVYDLTFILHCFSMSIWEATHYFCAPVFCKLFYWKQGRSSLGESVTDTRLSWAKKVVRALIYMGNRMLLWQNCC